MLLRLVEGIRDRGSRALRLPLLRTGRALFQLPFVAEQVPEKVVAPLRWRRGPDDFGATSDGIGADAITGGPEVIWTTTPTKWSNNFFWNLFGYEWELEKSPAGAKQWKAKGAGATIPDPFDKSKKHVPKMLTTDLALRF